MVSLALWAEMGFGYCGMLWYHPRKAIRLSTKKAEDELLEVVNGLLLPKAVRRRLHLGWMLFACFFWRNSVVQLSQTNSLSSIRQRNGEKLWFRPSRCKDLVSVDKSWWLEGWSHNIPQSHIWIIYVSQYSCYGGMTAINHKLTVW